MSTAFIVIGLVFLFIIGGMMILLKNANQKFPDTYDKSKTGFDDLDDDDRKKPGGTTSRNQCEKKTPDDIERQK